MRHWSDDYTIGIAGIDQHHRMLFKMAEDIQTALDEGQSEAVYGRLLQTLALYARYHFAFEERCMDQYHCPMAPRNRAAHAKFAALLAEFQQRYAARGFDLVDACTLMAIIDEWLTDHICGIDVHLRPYVQNAGITKIERK
jgi:hemerythrin